MRAHAGGVIATGVIMLRNIVITLSLFFAGFVQAAAETSLYEDLLSLEFMNEQFESKVTETGIDLDSKDKIQVTEEISVSKIHINLEGPFPIPEGTTLDQAMNFNIDSIIRTTELNKDYPKKDRIAEGIGAVKVNVNGLEVGYIEYQVPSMNMAKFRRAIIVKDKKMYGFTLAYFDPSVDVKRGKVFDALIIMAVNSGKL